MVAELEGLAREVPLAPRTTLELGGAAERFYEARDEAGLRAALALAASRSWPVTFLGGGSNVLVPDEGVPGLVVAPALRGVRYARLDDGRVEVLASAGEPWDALVARAVADGLAGLECLSGIPGSVGATPIQNVGAYGVEVADVITRVRALDRTRDVVVELGRDACGFSYRDSHFKRDPGRYVVLEVGFALRESAPLPARYAELARALPRDADLDTVRRTVVALRASKSMVIDPADPNRRSVGSFFTNPVVSEAQAADVVARAIALGIVSEARDVPTYAAAGGVKLAAGWLIERSGTAKGERSGSVGVSTRHALCLVHHGGGTTAEMLEFAALVEGRVERTFGVRLVREPVLFSSRKGSPEGGAVL